MRLKELRENMQLSQIELSKKLNLSQTTISRWESSKTEPTSTWIVKLSKFFNVSSDYLLELTDDFDKSYINSNLTEKEQKLLKRCLKICMSQHLANIQMIHIIILIDYTD